jgi:hypothetical protein
VNDLEGSMKKVYKECFGSDELPAHIPIEHPPRERKNYSMDRSLAELGINEEEIKKGLEDYIDWCQSSTGSK